MGILDNEGHDPQGLGNTRAAEKEVLCACTDSCALKDAISEALFFLGSKQHKNVTPAMRIANAAAVLRDATELKTA